MGEQAEKMAENSFVTNAWGKWLSKLQDCDIYNVHIMDLFYWEHWAGNFGAMGQADWDIIMDEFTPYSCRNLLTNMLGVDERFRDHDEPVLHRALAARMWPQALCEPVNPTSPLIRIRGLTNIFLSHSGSTNPYARR